MNPGAHTMCQSGKKAEISSSDGRKNMLYANMFDQENSVTTRMFSLKSASAQAYASLTYTSFPFKYAFIRL